MNPDCLFCQIAADPTQLVWQNDVAAAFKDIHPKAPVHVLVVPKQHVENLDQLKDIRLAGELLLAVQAVAKSQEVAGAYRVMINVGRPAGQVVDHLHLHVLGGKPLD